VNSIIDSLSIECFTHLFLAALVMAARTSDRDVHDLGCFAQTQILIEDEMQRLALASRQIGQCLLKPLLHFGSLEFNLGL
jgi:hypothetical protein